MNPFEKRPEKGKVLPFREPAGPTDSKETVQPSQHDNSFEEPVDFQAIRAKMTDERVTDVHRALAEKFRRQRDATENFEALLQKPSATDINAAVREMVVELSMKESGISRATAERELDTQLLTERAQADMPEELFLALRRMPKEEADEHLEHAYAQAKAKYGKMYPAADPTMFGQFKELDALLKKPQTPNTSPSHEKKQPRSMMQVVKDWMSKLFT